MTPPMESRSAADWTIWAVPLAASLALTIISGSHVGAGIATHGDSRTIIEETVPNILRGAYLPSRSYGNPLYEYAVALLYPAGGVWLTSLYSFLLALACIWIANSLIAKGAKTSTRVLALGSLCLNPLFLINAFAITEWMQAAFLMLCLLWFSRRWLQSAGVGALAGIAAASCLLVLTRPDGAVVCTCVAVALIWQFGVRDLRRIAALATAMLLAAIAAVAVFGLLNHGYAFIKTGLLFGTSPYIRRAFIACVGVYSAFGPLAPLILLGTAVVAVHRSIRDPQFSLSLWMKIFLLTVPLVFVRFTVMPDKLEYILILLVLATIMIANEDVRLPLLALYALSSIAPSIATLSLFQRAVGSDSLSVRPHLGPGAVAQDLAAMTYNWRLMSDPRVAQSLSDRVYASEPPPHPQIFSSNWAAGLLSSDRDLLIGKGEVYHLDSGRGEDKYQRHLFRRVFVCDREVWVNGSFGWRLAEPALVWAGIAPDGQVSVSCPQEAPRS